MSKNLAEQLVDKARSAQVMKRLNAENSSEYQQIRAAMFEAAEQGKMYVDINIDITDDIRKLLHEQGIAISYSGKGNCYQFSWDGNKRSGGR